MLLVCRILFSSLRFLLLPVTSHRIRNRNFHSHAHVSPLSTPTTSNDPQAVACDSHTHVSLLVELGVDVDARFLQVGGTWMRM